MSITYKMIMLYIQNVFFLIGIKYYKKKFSNSKPVVTDFQIFMDQNLQIENLKKEIKNCHDFIIENKNKNIIETEERKKSEKIKDKIVINLSNIIKEKENKEKEIQILKNELINIKKNIFNEPTSNIQNFELFNDSYNNSNNVDFDRFCGKPKLSITDMDRMKNTDLPNCIDNFGLQQNLSKSTLFELL